MFASFFASIARAWRALFGGSPMASVVPRIGDLRDRVIIERRARLAIGEDEAWQDADESWEDARQDWDQGDGDGAGNYETAEWRELIDARAARIAPTRGGEEVLAGRLSGVEAFDIWVRSDAATRRVTVGDRVIDARDRSRIFNIRWIGNLDGRGQFLLLQCQAGVAD